MPTTALVSVQRTNQAGRVQAEWASPEVVGPPLSPVVWSERREGDRGERTRSGPEHGAAAGRGPTLSVMRAVFPIELEQLGVELATMCGLAGEALEKASRALLR